jgi:hypothetical protein
LLVVAAAVLLAGGLSGDEGNPDVHKCGGAKTELVNQGFMVSEVADNCREVVIVAAGCTPRLKMKIEEDEPVLKRRVASSGKWVRYTAYTAAQPSDACR